MPDPVSQHAFQRVSEPGARNWMVISNYTAMTSTHIDASGTCTIIRAISGRKLIYLTGDLDIVGDDGFFDNSKARWETVLLIPGNIL